MFYVLKKNGHVLKLLLSTRSHLRHVCADTHILSHTHTHTHTHTHIYMCVLRACELFLESCPKMFQFECLETDMIVWS